MPFEVYTKLYDVLVLSIINYGSAIWGNGQFSCINSIHNKACRFYLGVGRYTPNSAVQGDMGWKPMYQNIWLNIVKHWCNVIKMEETRTVKKVFMWAYEQAQHNRKNWVYHTKQMFQDTNIAKNILNNEINNTNTIIAELEVNWENTF